MVLNQLCGQGARVAQPGEFTLRAFLAGRIDLTHAEAVLGVIDATSSQQLDVALEQMAGGLSRPLLRLREALLQLLAQIEAGLDFVEEDIEFISRQQILDQLASALEIVGAVQVQMISRGNQAALPRVVLLGSPNAGKSSLFNALLRQRRTGRGVQPRAIVSDQPGTTRDYVTARLPLSDFTCELVDTAGDDPHSLHSTIDQAAQTFASQQQHRADVRLLCIAAPWLLRDLSVWEGMDSISPDLILITQADQATDAASRRLLDIRMPAEAILCSSHTGEGLHRVLVAIEGLVWGAVDAGPQAVAATATRCTGSLRKTDQSLSRAHGLTEEDGGTELIAAELRIALDSLGKVVGTIYTDDILDRIFGQFCIGK
jgi:tRNA modification GTPase